LGCELSPKKIVALLLNLQGMKIAEKTALLDKPNDKFAILKQVVNTISGLIGESKVVKNRISGLGFVDPGVVNIETGFSVISTILPGWENVPTKDFLEEKLNLPVMLIGTYQAKALAEHLFGKGKGIDNFVFVEYTEGIACGIVSEGKLIRGKMEIAGELGHYHFAEREETCHCGGKGCLEALASLLTIEKKARDYLKAGAFSEMRKMCNNNLARLTYSTVLEAAKNSDKLAQKILGEAGHFLSVAVANLIKLLNPELVILDKNFSLFDETFLSHLFYDIKKEALFSNHLRFEISDFGTEQGSLGGAGLILKKFLTP